MNRVILDQALRARLNDLTEVLELFDESGERLGYFLPRAVFRDMLFDWADAQISPEEWELLRQQKGGRPLAEIWKSLGRT
jgi:hypothetical protein